MSSLKHSTIVSVAWKLFDRVGNQLISLVIQLFLARLLTPSDYGALALLVVFINISNLFVQNGFNTSLIQAKNVNQVSYSSVFWFTLCIAAVLCVFFWSFAVPITTYFGIQNASWHLRILSLTLLTSAYSSILIAIISREFRFKEFVPATLVSSLSSGCSGIAMAYIGLGLWALVAQQLLYSLAYCACLVWQEKWFPSVVFSWKETRRMLGFGWKLTISGLLETGYQSLSDLIIGKQFTASNLGLVSQGKKIPMVIGNSLDGAIQPVMLSAVAHVQDDMAYVKRLVRRALKTSTYLIVPSMILLAVVAEPVVRLLLGEQWLPAVPFLQMYCVIYMLLPIHTSNLQALNGMGRSDLFLKLELIKKVYGVVFVLVGAFVFQDVYVLVGSYILSGVISTFVNAWPNRKVIGYSYIEQVKDICPAFLLATVSAAVAFPIGMLALPDVAVVLLQADVMAACYLGLSKLFKVEAFDYLLATAKEVVVLRRR